MFLTIPRLLLLTPLLATLAAAADPDSPCYFVNKNRAVDDVPCNTTSTGASVCCSKNDICLSNGLCYIQGSNGPSLSRGSCTDQNWSGACATSKPCASHNPQSGYRVVNAVGNQYCCGSVKSINSQSIICQADRAFYVAPGQVMTGVAGLASGGNSSSSAGDGSSSSNNNNGSNSDKSARLAIGLGLGIPLGLIAASALAWGGWERRQKAISAREVQELKAMNGSPGGMSGSGTMNSTSTGMVASSQYGYADGQGQGLLQMQPVELEQSSGRRPVELDAMGSKRRG